VQLNNTTGNYFLDVDSATGAGSVVVQ